MATSQNDWPVAAADSPILYTWLIPAKTGDSRLRLRHGSAGFVLAHYALWFAETVEPLRGKVLDDWGYAYRPIRGQQDGYSNHASGTAMDLNATKHGLGKSGTFTPTRTHAIRLRLRATIYGGCLRWGGDYHGRKDEMHVELVKPLPAVERVARRLMKTPRGKRLLAANPSQKKVILS